MELRLFGTLTSPYVRRVRAVAHELGQPVELVDTFSEAGQAELRELNPLWRVPSAQVDGQLVFDSHAIVDHLLELAEDAPIARPAASDLESQNVIAVIDGALDSLINVFYLERDGLRAEPGSYLAKQRERVAASMAWLDGRVQGNWITPVERFGLAEIALCTTLGWMRFRQTYPVEQHPALLRCFEHHDARPSLAATRPPA